MPIIKESTIDYNLVCKELNISKEDLLSLIKSKNNNCIKSKLEFTTIANEFLQNLENKVKAGRKRLKTYKDYHSLLNQFNNFIKNNYNEPFFLEQLTEPLMFDFFDTCNSRKDDKLSPYTINKYQAIIKSVMKYAYHMDYIDRDLSIRLEFEKITKLPRYFMDEQIGLIIKHSINRTYGYRWQTIMYFMLYTGCRISEVTNLKVKDFDIENNLIFVNGKGNKDRYIPMYEKLKRIVLRYLEMTHLPSWSKDYNGYLFSRDEGYKREKMISNRSLSYQIKNILTDANIQGNFTPHSFRHTFAVNCLKADWKLPYLSQVLGHTNPETTNIYVQLLPIDLRNELMDKFPFPVEKLLDEII